MNMANTVVCKFEIRVAKHFEKFRSLGNIFSNHVSLNLDFEEKLVSAFLDFHLSCLEAFFIYT